MSEITVQKEDLTPEEKLALDSYIKNGCPGLLRITDVDTFKWFELYMSGKTYSEISDITKHKKDLVMYVAFKSKWHEKKIAYYEDIANNMAKKIAKSRIDSMNTVTSISAALGKYLESKMNDFLSTGNTEVIEGLDTKILSQYYKSIEIVESVVPKNGANEKTPNININANNATVTTKENGDVEISANTNSEILRIMADFKKSNSGK